MTRVTVLMKTQKMQSGTRSKYTIFAVSRFLNPEPVMDELKGEGIAAVAARSGIKLL